MENHSEETGNEIDAVEMTRRIRDERYERVKNMTPEERLEYYREKSAGRPPTIHGAHPERGRGGTLNNLNVATGSACTSAGVEPSHVITAMHDE